MQHSVHGAVTAKVSASVANLGPAFDVHSISLQKPTIEVTLSESNSGLGLVRVTGPYARIVTTDPALHAGARALKVLNQQLGISEAYVLEVNVEIPPRKGLGLSGAEAVGAVLCANRLFNLGLDMQAVVHLAVGCGAITSHGQCRCFSSRRIQHHIPESTDQRTPDNDASPAIGLGGCSGCAQHSEGVY